MNPSSNLVDKTSGLSNLNANDVNYGYNSRTASRSSKARLYKMRKPSDSQKMKVPGISESGVEPGFNPFRSESVFDSNAFVFGENRNKLFNENKKGGFVSGSCNDTFDGLKLQEDMRKLKIDGNENANLSANDSGKFVFKGNVESELENELKKKLSVKDIEEDDMKKFVHSSCEKSSDSFAANELLDRMKNLNLTKKKDDNVTSNKKDGFLVSSNKGSSDYLVGERENVLSNEMGKKCNIGGVTSDFAGQANIGRMSSRVFVKDKQTGNLGDKKSYDSGKSVPMEYAFRTAMQGKNTSGILYPVDQTKDDARLSDSGSSLSTFSSGGVHFQSVDNASKVPGMDRTEKMNEFSFTSCRDGMGSPFVPFKTPNLKANLFSGTNEKLEFSAKRESVRDAKVKKRKGKLRQPISVPLWHGQDFALMESGSQENTEPSESYSPMEISPYHQTLVDARCSRETSLASVDSFCFNGNDASMESQPTVSNAALDEDLVAAAQRMDINDGDVECRDTKEEHSDRGVGSDGPPEESVSGAETESFKSANEDIDFNIDNSINSAETEANSSSSFYRQDSDSRMQFSFPSHSEEIGRSTFTFAASSAGQGHLSTSKCRHKKKNLVYESFNKTPHAKVPLASSSVQFSSFSGASPPLSSWQAEKGDQVSPQFKVERNSQVDIGQEIKQEPNLTSAITIAAQEACEKWRLRGNQAYNDGNLSKAEDCYTQGINCISKSETSRSCLRALLLCYSNRAATLMSLGRMRDALADCMLAVAFDPNFLRVQVRAANCYLALGEVGDASKYFRKCLQPGSDICVDRKIAVEASDGLQKAQKVFEYMQHSAQLLQNKTSNDAENALGVIDEALLISSYSEKLIEMKAGALFSLRKYEEAIQLCEQTFNSAGKNSPPLNASGQITELDGSESGKDVSFRLWRCRLIFKSHVNLGRLEEAIASLKKQELGIGEKMLESFLPLAGTVRELLRHKVAGNEAFQAGRHSEAVEHYTAALSFTVESRPFAAICFCNRATAYKALGHITDAIADCNLAMALDRNYLKAISRRATLYEMIRDYGQAADDLQRLIALLTKQVEKNNQSGASDRSINVISDLRQARIRLTAIEEEARKDVPLDMYLILGIEPSVSASDIKKAYRKAALRHHPDKAGQSLVRSDNGDDGLWKEIGEEVHKDADRLFKMIGEAYAVLSDPNKQSRYDLEEEMRNAQKKRNGSNTSRTHTDAQNYLFERSGNRRQWREVWRSYGNSAK